MIIILYAAGTFGSTMEYCLSNFSNELDNVVCGLTETGSMHGFNKQLHITTFDEFAKSKDNVKILTPVYPTVDYLSPRESVQIWKQKFNPEDRVVFAYCPTIEDLERNHLFLYYKLEPVGFLLDIILKDRAPFWNTNYQTWRDMEQYELREALSFFIDQLDTFLGVENEIPASWYKVTPDDMLLNFERVIEEMISHCGLTRNLSSINEFYHRWRRKQQYVLDEFENINQITNHIVKDQYFEWPEMSIVGESIVQSRLRKQGIEIACYKLNKFPNNTNNLKRYFV